MPAFLTPWRAVSAMFLLNGALLGIWASRIPTIREAQGLDKSQFGLLLLVMAVGALLSFPVAGRLADRFGAVLLTRILAVLYAVSLVGIALAPVSVLALGATMFLFGATHGAMDVTMNSWATEVEKAAGRPIMSSFHALWSVGTGLGALSGFFAGQIDLETSLHFLLAAVIFSAVCLPFSVVAWKSETVAGGSGSGAPLVSLPKSSARWEIIRWWVRPLLVVCWASLSWCRTPRVGLADGLRTAERLVAFVVTTVLRTIL